MSLQSPEETISLIAETWSPSTETAYPDADPGLRSVEIAPEPAGGVLRRHAGEAPAGSRTQARIADEVADEAARRLGTLAILTAVTIVGAAILQQALQPEMAAIQKSALYRLSGLFLVIAGIALASFQRAGWISSQELLDLGLVFEIVGAGALSLMENTAPWPDSVIRGFTPIAAWIAICVVVIPNRPWKSTTAAFLSAAMVPTAHLIAAQVLGFPALPGRRLAAYSLSAFFVAGWTPFISTRMHRMQQQISLSHDLGSYQLERLLGRGGMGEVWLARHRFLRREAAVKLVLRSLLERTGPIERRQVQKRFESEAQAIASLRSPHTVEIYDYGLAENGSLYYAMEFLHGLDAEKLVDQYGPQPSGRVVGFLRQACESLEEAHDAGLVHRDVKASNLFVCRLGKRADFIKLLDFGLVKTLPNASRTARTTYGVVGGTPAFMAPEQVRGEEVDARTDIYGLGCVAYFLLTGSVVFNRPTATATLLAHVTELPEPPSKRSASPVPESLERVVMACLEKRREDRPQSAAELRAMLEAAPAYRHGRNWTRTSGGTSTLPNAHPRRRTVRIPDTGASPLISMSRREAGSTPTRGQIRP